MNDLPGLLATSGGLADAAHPAHRLLIDARLFLRVRIRDFDGFACVRGIQISTDLFAQAFSALVDPATAEDLHLRAAVDLAEIVDELSHCGDAAGECAEHDGDVGT